MNNDKKITSKNYIYTQYSFHLHSCTFLMNKKIFKSLLQYERILLQELNVYLHTLNNLSSTFVPNLV